MRELVTEYQVKGTATTMTRTLSAGNQQKVCIAKWLDADPDFVVLDEPTKGIDVGARANIYEIVHAFAQGEITRHGAPRPGKEPTRACSL